MGACSEFKESLVMDILGELSSEQKDELKRHLEKCAKCRHEQERVRRILRIAQNNVSEAQLGPVEVAEMRSAITDAVYPEKGLSWYSFPKKWWRVMVPAVGVIACLLVISFASFNGWWPRKKLVRKQDTALTMKEKGEITDPELIKDMELLEQIDTLRMLVKVVDNKDII